MNKFFIAALLAGTVFTTVAMAGEIPVNKVILSTSGLANFEHSAKISGDSKVEFPVRLDQVDDILKSLVVFDADGKLGGVTLPGKQPLAQVFKDLPFTQAQLSQPTLLLNAYQGAVVTVKSKDAAITGKILRVEAFNSVDKDGKAQTKSRISLMTNDGIKQAVLEDAQSLQFDDAKIKTEIARALDAIRENGSEGRRVLTVNLAGAGDRDVTLSYVVDAPLWKSSYRMVVPEVGKDKGLLQGWAIVENMTASDWNNVDLTLVSGNPVTFRQNLYQSYYVDRPEIPVQVFGRVMPRVDEGAIANAADMERPMDRMEAKKSMRMDKSMMDSAPAPAAMMAMGAVGGSASNAMEMMAESDASMATVAHAANAAQSAEATTQVLFRFPSRFDLKSGQSMMVPFVSRDVPMERVSLYQPETHATHPLAAVEISNDGETGLPPGVLTMYEESALLKGTAFVGDAQLPVMAQGEKRFISYALDSKTSIAREDKSTSTEGKISISGGILRTAMKNRSETVYTVKAPPKEARVVVLEHPKLGDYKLVSPDPKDVVVADNRYRIRVTLAAGETKVVPVVLENETWNSWGIDGMASDQLLAYATSSGNNLDPETRKIFEGLAAMRREMDKTDQEIAALDQQRMIIFQDQERVRENLKALSGKSDVQQKYLDKLGEQEDQIAKIDAAREKLSNQRLRQEEELRRKINEMQF